MLGRQLRRTLLLEKQQQRNSLGKAYFSSTESKQNEAQATKKIKQLTFQIKRLLGLILEYQLLQKESFSLDPNKIKEMVRQLEKKKKLDNIRIQFSEQHEHRWIRMAYLSFWRELQQFRESLYTILIRTTERYDNQLKNSQFSIQQLYNSIISLLLEKITTIRNTIIQKTRQSPKVYKPPQKQCKPQEPIKLKQVEKAIKKSIYGGLNIDKIEAVTYFIDGLDIKDNISIIYDKQTERNRRARKDRKQYQKKYRERQYRIRSRSNPERTRPQALQLPKQESILPRSNSTYSKKKQPNNPNRITLQPLNPKSIKTHLPQTKKLKLK